MAKLTFGQGFLSGVLPGIGKYFDRKSAELDAERLKAEEEAKRKKENQLINDLQNPPENYTQFQNAPNLPEIQPDITKLGSPTPEQPMQIKDRSAVTPNAYSETVPKITDLSDEGLARYAKILSLQKTDKQKYLSDLGAKYIKMLPELTRQDAVQLLGDRGLSEYDRSKIAEAMRLLPNEKAGKPYIRKGAWVPARNAKGSGLEKTLPDGMYLQPIYHYKADGTLDYVDWGRPLNLTKKLHSDGHTEFMDADTIKSIAAKILDLNQKNNFWKDRQLTDNEMVDLNSWGVSKQEAKKTSAQADIEAERKSLSQTIEANWGEDGKTAYNELQKLNYIPLPTTDPQAFDRQQFDTYKEAASELYKQGKLDLAQYQLLLLRGALDFGSVEQFIPKNKYFNAKIRQKNTK